MASQITKLTSVYSSVYLGSDQRKHQSYASLAFVWGIHRWPVNSHTNGQWRGKCFHLMTSSWVFAAFAGDDCKCINACCDANRVLSILGIVFGNIASHLWRWVHHDVCWTALNLQMGYLSVLLTYISYTKNNFGEWISNYIHIRQWDVVPHPCPDLMVIKLNRRISVWRKKSIENHGCIIHPCYDFSEYFF